MSTSKHIEIIDDIPYVPFPIAFHTVDVIAMRKSNSGIEFLLGKKPNQDKWQFVGGFVEPTHTSEQTAIKEFEEEASVFIENEDRLKYIGSSFIDDIRYKDSCHKITTSIFKIELTIDEYRMVQAGDDLEIVEWFEAKEVYSLLREQHKEIFVKCLVTLLN